MRTVHIPSSQQFEVKLVDWGKDLYLNFSDPGMFTWTTGGREFNPHLPHGRVLAGRLGRYVAPNHNDEVHWVFVPDTNGEETSGIIKVLDDQALDDEIEESDSRGEGR